jgi:hypothetical protein
LFYGTENNIKRISEITTKIGLVLVNFEILYCGDLEGYLRTGCDVMYFGYMDTFFRGEYISPSSGCEYVCPETEKNPLPRDFNKDLRKYTALCRTRG